MSKLTLQQMREKLLEQENRKNNFSESGGDRASFPFWNIPTNSLATIRYLPDGDDDNSWPWVEKMTIKIPFQGVKGGDASKQIIVQVPCMEMYGKSCPIQEEIKPWWKGSEDDKNLARTYYKKRSYLYQGFVVTNPMKEENSPENPIRRFMINQKLHEKTKAAFMDPEIDFSVVDMEHGRDFKIAKTKSGNYDAYDTSSFSMKERPLSQVELEAIEKYGLFKLRDFMPKEPDDQTIKLIFEMFQDSLQNEAFDAEKYKSFRPNNFSGNSNNTSVQTTKSTDVQDVAKTEQKVETVAPVAQKEVVQDAVVAEATAPTIVASESAKPKKSAAEIMEILQKRKQQVQG